MAFIFPWATIFGQPVLLAAEPRWGWLTLIEMFIFIGILILGLVYVWIKGDLEWIRPRPLIPATNNSIPLSAYDKINNEDYKLRAFEKEVSIPDPPSHNESPAAVAHKPPAFKPVFRKPPPK
jgi:NADH-quinone oxidoreductase subunit A